MAHLKFDPAKLHKLNDPARLESLRPEVFVAAWRLEAPAVIVEIGAGTGMFAAEFVSGYPGVVVYAVDTVEAMVAWMRENRPEVGDGRIVPVLSAEENVPLNDGIADGVCMINLHHELAAPEAIYAEAWRLLAPFGRVLVADWAPTDTPKGPPLHVRATAEDIACALESAGFIDIEIHAGLPWHSLVTATRSGE